MCVQLQYGADQWPPGCIDFAFNLVRPRAPAAGDVAAGALNLRPTLFHTLLGKTLVFTTLEAAEAYRTLVTQQLAGACGDIVTLDGHKVRANGIVCGASFQVAPLHVASYRFAQLPASKVRILGCLIADALAFAPCSDLARSSDRRTCIGPPAQQCAAPARRHRVRVASAQRRVLC